ncbi:acyl-ACP thioesterase [Pseudodesulfovibrio sp. JC047]|uniref:acyl-[acyl-carrier-protein] thioesterase n=1 Tax=Pseudodesulfovibrio sp. JC047 TaxID=2683199 RepID=UPI0013D86CB9|nr:acyl-ACP thioesterase domain-containing protein [Pseudodesulfovibrio sp. JC047]NDV18427.1 acyl-ACP thioesterase [Pseudodesulfovibrio sp. JC047]
MTKHTPLTLEQPYNIRSYEPQTDGRIPISALCNYLQDIASRHADTLGFGLLDLRQSGHFWVLARLHVMMDRMPGFGEQLHIETWPSGNERLVALRDFLIHDAHGLVGRATSSWATVNRKTHRPDDPSTVLDKRYIPDRDHAMVFPSKAITRLKKGDHPTQIKARRADTDVNGHVNNVKYVEYCMEAVPQSWIETHQCLGLDIQFRTESFAGQEFQATCTESTSDSDMETILHALNRPSDTREIVRMKTWWEQA